MDDSSPGDATSAQDLADRLLRVARELRRRGVEALGPWGLSPHHARALRVIRREGSPRLGHVAELLRIAPRSATDVVDALEQRGLVERSPDPADRRASCVRLTEQGGALMGGIDRARASEAEHLFAALSEKDRRELGRILTRLEPEQH